MASFLTLPPDIRKNYLLHFLPISSFLTLTSTNQENYQLRSREPLWSSFIQRDLQVTYTGKYPNIVYFLLLRGRRINGNSVDAWYINFYLEGITRASDTKLFPFIVKIPGKLTGIDWGATFIYQLGTTTITLGTNQNQVVIDIKNRHRVNIRILTYETPDELLPLIQEYPTCTSLYDINLWTVAIRDRLGFTKKVEEQEKKRGEADRIIYHTLEHLLILSCDKRTDSRGIRSFYT